MNHLIFKPGASSETEEREPVVRGGVGIRGNRKERKAGIIESLLPVDAIGFDEDPEGVPAASLDNMHNERQRQKVKRFLADLDQRERRAKLPAERRKLAEIRAQIQQIRDDIDAHERSIMRTIDAAIELADHEAGNVSTRDSRAARVATIRKAISTAAGSVAPNAPKAERVAAIKGALARMGVDVLGADKLVEAIESVDAACDAIEWGGRELSLIDTNPGPMPSSSFYSDPRTALMDWGLHMLRRARLDPKGSMLDADANAAVVAMMRNAQRDGYTSKTEADARGHVRTAGEFIFTSSAWASCGFPIVQPTHKLSASLMATDIPADLVPQIALPWDAFVLAVPDGLVSIEGIPAKLVSVVDVHARGKHPTHKERYAVSVFAHGGRRGGMTKVCFDNLESLADAGPMIASQTNASAEVVRACEMLCRLVLGTLIELDAPAQKEMVRQGPPPPKQKNKREQPTPRAWVFELRRDVKVDARAWVREYVAKGGKSPSVQVLVRGHHKRQPWGKGRTMRKWIHVEPYWRGDEDAPIAVRAHRMGPRP